MKAHSYAVWTNRFTGKVEKETDFFVCGHCQMQVPVPVKSKAEDMGGLCWGCRRLICPGCVGKLTCDPIEEKLAHGYRTKDWRRWLGEVT